MKKIKTAVIGAGYLGRFHAQKYMELENSELIGVVDIDTGRAQKLAAEYGVTPYADYRDLFGKVDAVSVVTPTGTHCEIGLGFLSKGIDVLMEKPMAVTAEEADALIKEADRTGAVLQIGHLERFNPAVVALSGMVKNPMFIESHRLSPFPDRATDVDVVLDLMIHDIDIILNLVNSAVDSIDAVGIPVITDKIDIANARIKFKNGCVANVTASRVSKERLRRIRLFQPDAYISVDYASQRISIARLAHRKDSLNPAVIEEVINIEKKDALREEIKSFLECSGAGTPPPVTGSDGKRAIEVAAGIQEKMEESMGRLKGYPGATDAGKPG
ncbi:MAG: Gfo/Idh/MocA family oxidoreductase [Deltaproteobacteria bacterium]|nr:Gfo/Idh/MocA family oxidoreductase [Deltaproteobacteria bacterium]